MNALIKFFVGLCLLIFSACGENVDLPEELENQIPPISQEPPVSEPEAVLLVASRDYSPSSWNHATGSLNFSGYFEAPNSIDVVSGNAGTGWVSLYIGDRKFCYQGNASNNFIANGDKFILKREKSNTSTEYYSGSNNIAADTSVSLNSGDTVKLEVNGGGCSVSGSTCMYTEIHLSIDP